MGSAVDRGSVRKDVARKGNRRAGRRNVKRGGNMVALLASIQRKIRRR
jgi:hypothetical protein